MTVSRSQLLIAVSAVLFDVTNFPRQAQARLLGKDMRPLTEQVAEAVMPLIRQAQAEAWWEGVNDQWNNEPQGVRILEQRNPYKYPAENVDVAQVAGVVEKELQALIRHAQAEALDRAAGEISDLRPRGFTLILDMEARKRSAVLWEAQKAVQALVREIEQEEER